MFQPKGQDQAELAIDYLVHFKQRGRSLDNWVSYTTRDLLKDLDQHYLVRRKKHRNSVIRTRQGTRSRMCLHKHSAGCFVVVTDSGGHTTKIEHGSGKHVCLGCFVIKSIIYIPLVPWPLVIVYGWLGCCQVQGIEFAIWLASTMLTTLGCSLWRSAFCPSC